MVSVWSCLRPCQGPRESPASRQSLGKKWKTLERFTQLAKLSIDRSADRLNSQLTYFFSFFIKYLAPLLDEELL